MRGKLLFCKKIVVISALFVLLSSIVLPPEPAHAAPAQALSTSAQAAIVMSADGDVLYSKNSDARLPMASTTKIMTALVALESAPLDSEITVTKESVGVEGTSAYLTLGERLTLRDLLYALLLQSANDAASAIAVGIAGSIEAFSDMMNDKAAELGLCNTHFTNPHGLDDEQHYTSASELATIAAVALKNDQFRQIVSSRKYVSTALTGMTRWFTNHNRMLMTYDGAIGVKTGYTMRTGRCLVSAAERDGLTLIAVTLNDPNDWRDHTVMLDYGFSCFEQVTLASVGQYSAILALQGSSVKTISCSNRDELTVWLPKGAIDEIEVELELPRFEYAPLSKDVPEGSVRFFKDGRELGALPIYPEFDIEREPLPLTVWGRIGSFFMGLLKLLGRLFAKRSGVSTD